MRQAERQRDRSGKLNVRALLLLMVVVLAWGSMWPVNKALLAYVSPIWSVALRTYISMLTLFAISLCLTGLVLPARQDLPVLISMVVLHMVAFTILSQLALQWVPAGRSAVLAYTSVLWAPIGAAVFLGETLSRRRILGLGLGILGLLAIFNPFTFHWGDPNAVLGNALLLLAAMLWAASIVHNRGHLWRSTPFQLAPWQALLAALLLTLAAWSIEGPPQVTWTWQALLLLLFAGIPGTAIAYWAAAVSSSELPAATTSLGLLATPAVSVAVALVLLGEAPSLALLLALALLIGGIAVGATGPGRPGS
ncbi:MAG TPA: DMT family transporter [Hyphomicrobiaceae bacterium]|nr:DMT family transporter [Hyphomicrobiaceae bacterium]